MKSFLGKSVAEHIITQNQKLKNETILLKKDLKKLQDRMMETLDQLALTLSSKLKDYKKFLLFDNPYDCMTAFVTQIIKSAQFSSKTFQQNKILLSTNEQLTGKIKKVQQESQERFKKQEQIIQELNKQIDSKKERLIKLQEDYQGLLKAKKVAQKQLNETKESMKILRLKLYEEQRQKLTEIIVANKKEMVEFRRSMQMQSYKQQLEFKRQISEKDHEIKLLTKNIQELINSNLNASSDLTVLQKIVKPIRESTQMKDEISSLRKEISSLKHQIREKHSTILGLQGQNADITMNRDNLNSRNQRLQIEKSLLTINLNEKTQQLEKAINDRKALDLYYSEKWHSQFSKVKTNLEEKYGFKIKSLHQQYEQKKKEIESQIEAYLERLRIMKNQLTAVYTKNEELAQVNQILTEKTIQQQFHFDQLSKVVKESQNFQKEDLLARTLIWNQQVKRLQQQIQKLSQDLRMVQNELTQAISSFNFERNNFLRQKLIEIENLKQVHRIQKEEIQQKHQSQLLNLQKHYSNSKQSIQAIRIAEMIKFQKKLATIYERHQQQLKEVQKNAQTKLIKINQKLNQSDLKYQKLRKRRQDDIDQLNRKIADLQKVLHQRELQLISRDVELEQYGKMKDKYLAEIKELNLKLNEQIFKKESLQVELSSAENRLDQKQTIVKNLQSRKYKLKEDLLQFQKEYKQKFEQLDKMHKKMIMQCKRKANQLEKLFEKRPIQKQHFQKIQSLEKNNYQLKTQIHLKQAQNLVLNEVKEYYQQKAQDHYITKSKLDDQQVIFLSTNSLFKKTNDSMKQTVKINQKPVFVKKYSNRKNKLISSGFKLELLDQSEKQSQTKQMVQMKRYLSKQYRVNETSSLLKNKRQNQRVHSSMM